MENRDLVNDYPEDLFLKPSKDVSHNLSSYPDGPYGHDPFYSSLAEFSDIFFVPIMRPKHKVMGMLCSAFSYHTKEDTLKVF